MLGKDALALGNEGLLTQQQLWLLARLQVGAGLAILSYWLCAIPLAYHLAFRRGMGLTGLWAATAAATWGQGLLLLTYALRFDFEGEAAKAAAAHGLRQPLLGDEDDAEGQEAGSPLDSP